MSIEERIQAAARELCDLTSECGPVEVVEFRTTGQIRPGALVVVAHGQGVAQALLDLLPSTTERRVVYDTPGGP